MPPNQVAYEAFFTPGTLSICDCSRYGSDEVIDSFEVVMRRLVPATFALELNATRTESSMPNSRNAVTTDSSVRKVRVLLRNSAAQIRCRYFISASSRMFPSPARGRRCPKGG